MRKQLTDGAEQEPRTELQEYMGMIMEAARNPEIDPAKLMALLDVQERVLNRSAQAEWTQAMTACQQEIRKVRTNRKNSQTNSKYATYEQLDKELRPFYIKHGFSLSGDTGQGDDLSPIPTGEVRIWLLVSHKGGWTQKFHVDMPADGKGPQGGAVMSRTHATGSAMTYGLRYLVKFAFNIIIGDEGDDDGNRASGRPQTNEPPAREESKPQAKSERKEAGTTAPASKVKQGRPDGYETVQKAKDEKSRLTESSYKTITMAMKRNKISEAKFKDTFGFDIRDLDKKGLNEVINWIQES